MRDTSLWTFNLNWRERSGNAFTGDLNEEGDGVREEGRWERFGGEIECEVGGELEVSASSHLRDLRLTL